MGLKAEIRKIVREELAAQSVEQTDTSVVPKQLLRDTMYLLKRLAADRYNANKTTDDTHSLLNVHANALKFFI